MDNDDMESKQFFYQGADIAFLGPSILIFILITCVISERQIYVAKENAVFCVTQQDLRAYIALPSLDDLSKAQNINCERIPEGQTIRSLGPLRAGGSYTDYYMVKVMTHNGEKTGFMFPSQFQLSDNSHK